LRAVSARLGGGEAMTEFTWEGVTFTVRLRSDGIAVFRDKAHLGGPWSVAASIICCTGAAASFKRALRKAVDSLPKEVRV